MEKRVHIQEESVVCGWEGATHYAYHKLPEHPGATWFKFSVYALQVHNKFV